MDGWRWARGRRLSLDLTTAAASCHFTTSGNKSKGMAGERMDDKTEKTALLDHTSSEDGGCLQRLYPSGFFPELKSIVILTAPMILTQVFQYMIGPVALMFCGHLGEMELAAVALANSFINITGITIALGLACACDTLFAQVYGSVNKTKLGVYLQRSILILLLAVLPCWAIHLNMEALLRLLGQDPQVARLAGRYLLIFMPGVPCFFVYICLSKYLQCQNIIIPNMVIGGVVNAANALLQYTFVYVMAWDVEGSALAQVVTYLLMLLLTLLYILLTGVYKATWEGFSWESLQAWGQFFRLGAFGLVMICAEYWSFEIGIITAGLLGVDYLGAMSVIFQLETFAYMLPLGTGIAASIRVGQYLGAGDARGAQTVARVTMTSICVAELGVAILFLTLQDYLPLIFTNVPEVVALVSAVLPVCALYQVSDGLAGTGAGILRGQGRQHLGAAIVLVGYASALVVGTPLMLYTPLKLFAFWGGLTVALTFEGITFALIIHFNDWEKQAREALCRVEAARNKTDQQEFEDDTLTASLATSEKLHLLSSTASKPPEKRSYQTSNNSHLTNDHSNDHRNHHSNDQANGSMEKLPSWSVIVVRRITILVLGVAIFVGGIFLRIFYTNTLELPLVNLPAPPNTTWQGRLALVTSAMDATL